MGYIKSMNTLMCDEEFALTDQLPLSGNVMLRRQGTDGLTVGSYSSWHRWAIDELEQINLLTEGWDGDQAPRPDKYMVASACGFVGFLSRHFPALPSPSVSLSPNSTVFLTWSQSTRTLDVEFTNSDTVRYFFKDRATNERQPGTLRHNRFDGYILSRLKEITGIDICEYSHQTA